MTSIFAGLFMDVLSHIPLYHEQHHLFLFSKEYLAKYLDTGDLLTYLTNFCIQFFYIPYAGSIFFALLLSLPYLLNVFICRHITKRTDYLQLSLLPSLYLLIQYESIDYPVRHVVGLLFCLWIYFFLSFLKGKQKYIVFVPAFLLLGYGLGWTYPLLSFLGVLVPSLSAFLFPEIQKKKYLFIGTLLMGTVYLTGTFYFFVHTYNMREHLLLQADKEVKNQHWEKVMAYCKRYRGENQLVSYFYNMALQHSGRMAYDLFLTPQRMGVQGLYLPWKSDSRQSEYGHYIYEQLGYLNEAHRWAFEALVVTGETAPILDNLIRYNIANGRPAVAMRFVRVLEQSLFYRKKAQEYEKIIQEKGSIELKALPHDEKEKIRFANVLNIGPELTYICDRDSSNQMAFEYLMSHLLLSNKIPRFVENLNRIQAFSYTPFPPIYEEALLTYRLEVGEEICNQLPFSISQETERRFQQYHSLYQKGQQEELKRQFANTYWYYLHFISPYGNKISTN